MRRSQFIEAQSIEILQDAAAGTRVRELCLRYGISERPITNGSGITLACRSPMPGASRRSKTRVGGPRSSSSISRSPTRCSKTSWGESGDTRQTAAGRRPSPRRLLGD